jgi:hypothetical protein
LNWEVELSPQVGCAIGASTTSKDTTISLNLEIISEEVPHSKKDVESDFKRNVKRRKRPPIDEWRLNDK